MNEICRVVKTEGNLIIVQKACLNDEDFSGGEACFGCMKTECKNRGIEITAENPLGLSLEEGQSVVIETPAAPVLAQTAAALGIPVLGFIAGFLLTGFLLPDSGESAKAAAGVLLMFLAALIFYQFRRKFPVKKIPCITGYI